MASTARYIVVAVTMMMLGIVGTVHAEDFGERPAFRVDAAPRAFAGTPAVGGYVYNDGGSVVTNVRVKVEVLDSDGAVVDESLGWVNGDIAAPGRSYFLVALKRAGASYRVSVVSFDLVTRGA